MDIEPEQYDCGHNPENIYASLISNFSCIKTMPAQKSGLEVIQFIETKIIHTVMPVTRNNDIMDFDLF